MAQRGKSKTNKTLTVRAFGHVPISHIPLDSGTLMHEPHCEISYPPAALASFT